MDDLTERALLDLLVKYELMPSHALTGPEGYDAGETLGTARNFCHAVLRILESPRTTSDRETMALICEATGCTTNKAMELWDRLRSLAPAPAVSATRQPLIALAREAANLLWEIPANAPNTIGLRGFDIAGRIEGALTDMLSAPQLGAQEVVPVVLREVEKAVAKFPTWPTDPLHALAVLGEEYGELNKAVLQLVYEPHKTSAEEVRTEAVQTAAMALRFLQSLQTYAYVRGEQHEQLPLYAAPMSARPEEWDILAIHSGSDKGREWHSQGAWLHKGEAIAVVTVPPMNSVPCK